MDFILPTQCVVEMGECLEVRWGGGMVSLVNYHDLERLRIKFEKPLGLVQRLICGYGAETMMALQSCLNMVDQPWENSHVSHSAGFMLLSLLNLHGQPGAQEFHLSRSLTSQLNGSNEDECPRSLGTSRLHPRYQGAEYRGLAATGWRRDTNAVDARVERIETGLDALLLIRPQGIRSLWL